MTIANLALPPDLEQFVQSQVASGAYPTEGEVVRDALRCLQDRERTREMRLQNLREQIAPALERLDRGEGIKLTDETLHEFFEDIKARGLKRWEAKQRGANT